MELYTGMKIKIFPETDTTAYKRMIKDHGYKSTVYRDHIIVGGRYKKIKLDNNKLASLIKQKRKKAKLTREELAAKLCITPATVYEWEIGRKQPRKDVMVDLKIVLNIQAEELEKCLI